MYLFIRLRRQKSFLWVSTIFRSSEKMTVSFSIWQRKIQICNSFCMDYRHLHENAFELINLRCLHFSTIFYSSSLYYGKLLTLHCEWKATIKLWIDFYYETRRDCESFAFIIQAFHLTFKAILHGARWRLVATFGGLRLLCYFPTSIGDNRRVLIRRERDDSVTQKRGTWTGLSGQNVHWDQINANEYLIYCLWTSSALHWALMLSLAWIQINSNSNLWIAFAWPAVAKSVFRTIR